MLGTRAAPADPPNSCSAPADIQYDSGGFSRNGVPASCGRARSLCWLMRQAMSASRGSSGVHRPRSRLPISHTGASATTTSRAHERLEGTWRDPGINFPVPEVCVQYHVVPGTVYNVLGGYS